MASLGYKPSSGIARSYGKLCWSKDLKEVRGGMRERNSLGRWAIVIKVLSQKEI